MKKFWLAAWLVLGAGLMLLGGWSLWSQQQSHAVQSCAWQLYQGNASTQALARASLKSMGAEAVPSLSRMLTRREPLWQNTLRSWTGRLPRALRDFVLPHLPAPNQAAQARLAGAQALGALGPAAARAVPALAHALRQPEPQLRAAAAAALGQIGAPALVALLEALKEPDSRVRYFAAEALGAMGAPAGAAIPRLLEALGEPDNAVRQRAAFSLLSLGPPALTGLLEAAAGPAGPARAAASTVLLGFYYPQGLAMQPISPRLLGDQAPERRGQAFERLGTRLDATNEVVMRLLLAGLKDPAPEGRLGAATALAHRTPRPALPLLLVNLMSASHDPQPEVRACSALALGQLLPGAKPALARLSALAHNDPDPRVRRSAQSALDSLGEAPAQPQQAVELPRRGSGVSAERALFD